jgi:hypothetical protein
MYRIFLVSTLALLFIGCEDSNQREKEDSSNAPKIKITQGVIKDKNISKGNKTDSGQFYYSYNKEKNSSTEEKRDSRTTLDAYLNIRSPYERIRVELLINKLSKDFRIKCSPCHDDYANGVIGPSLLGKSGDFIYNRIMEFKSGKKRNVLMQELVKRVDDSKLKEIADEIAEFNKQIQEIRKGKK